MKTCKEKILALPKKWRTYNQVCDDIGKGYNYGTIERNVRWLVEERKLETRTKDVKFGKITKRFAEFRRVK
jgi:hypothetical protein